MTSNACISDIAEVVMGQSPKGEDVNDTGEGFPLLNGPTEFTSRYPNPVQFTAQGRKFSNAGDILFCVRGSTTGRMNYADQKYAIGRGLAAIRGKNGYPTPYVRAVIERNLDRLLVAATGSTFPNVGRDLLLNFKVETVSPEESLSINKLIVSLEDKIELKRQTNQTLEHIVQAIFKSWFVSFEPVKAKVEAKQSGQDPEIAAMCAISGKTEDQLNDLNATALRKIKTTAGLFPDAFVESELSGIPDGWEAVPLGKYLEIKRGGSPRPIKEYIVEKGLPWTKIADATKEPSPFLFRTKECIKKEGLKKTVFLKKGALILSNSATPGLPKFLELDACIHDGWLHFPKKELFSDLYLYQLFLEIKKELIAQGNGSVFTNLKTDILRNQVVVAPTKEIIKMFDEVSFSIFESIKENCKEINTLSNLKDTLLSKLLSGELVSDSKKQATESAA